MDWLAVDDIPTCEIPPILAHKFKQRKELGRQHPVRAAAARSSP